MFSLFVSFLILCFVWLLFWTLELPWGWGQFNEFHSILLLKFPLANLLLSFTHILLLTVLLFFSHSLFLFSTLFFSVFYTFFLRSIVRCEPFTMSSRSFLCAAIASISLLTSYDASFWAANRFRKLSVEALILLAAFRKA